MNEEQIISCERPDFDTVDLWAPPTAPLAMPRQALERPARKSFIMQLAMLLFSAERT